MSILPQTGRPLCTYVGTAFLSACLVLGLAGPGKAAPVPQARGVARSGKITWPFAIADFDGDSKPDLATVQIGQITASHARYWIELKMSAGSRQFVGVTGPVGGLEIASRDVNGDRSLDLIITTAWLNRPIAVLLNDGHGNFTVHETASFLAAVCRDQASGACASVQINDAAAITRASGDCKPSQNVLSTRELPKEVIFDRSEGPASSLAVSALGRAPPCQRSFGLKDPFTSL
jgi:hypothetical protein